MAPSTNPMEYTYTSDKNSNSGSTSKSIPHPPPTSSVTHVISGIKTITYGLAELPESCNDVTVLWLLHPRLQTQACMAPFASQFIGAWNGRRKHNDSSRGLLAVSFDQRNHGTREVSPITNEAWRSGNEKHAQDMFSCYHGTSVDTSQLLDFLPAYIFPVGHPATGQPISITQNIVLGVSLGGHAAWHVVMQDPRFNAAIVTIGTSDYTRLMSDRARLSKRKTWMDSKGRDFVGSADFPPGLIEAVSKYDPAGLILGSGLPGRRRGQENLYESLTQDEKVTLLPLLTRTLGNKRILNLSGGSDKLVPYAMGKPFLEWLKKAIAPGGFFEGSGLYFEDVIVDGASHEVPPKMVEHMEKFLMTTLENETTIQGGKTNRRDSRI